MQHHHGLSPNKNQKKTIVPLFKIFAEALFLFFTDRLSFTKLLVKNKKKRVGELPFSQLVWFGLFCFFLAGRNFV